MAYLVTGADVERRLHLCTSKTHIQCIVSWVVMLKHSIAIASQWSRSRRMSPAYAKKTALRDELTMNDMPWIWQKLRACIFCALGLLRLLRPWYRFYYEVWIVKFVDQRLVADQQAKVEKWILLGLSKQVFANLAQNLMFIHCMYFRSILISSTQDSAFRSDGIAEALNHAQRYSWDFPDVILR